MTECKPTVQNSPLDHKLRGERSEAKRRSMSTDDGNTKAHEAHSLMTAVCAQALAVTRRRESEREENLMRERSPS